MKRRAAQEDGQLLILRPSEDGQPVALSGRPNGSTGKIPQPAAEVKEGTEENVKKPLEGKNAHFGWEHSAEIDTTETNSDGKREVSTYRWG